MCFSSKNGNNEDFLKIVFQLYNIVSLNHDTPKIIPHDQKQTIDPDNDNAKRLTQKIFKYLENNYTNFIKFQAVKDLETEGRKKKLYELHTHLLGMGSYEFWVNKVMCNAIPMILRKEVEARTHAGHDYPESTFAILADRFLLKENLTWKKLLSDFELEGDLNEHSSVTREALTNWLKKSWTLFVRNQRVEYNMDLSSTFDYLNFTFDVVYSEELLLRAMIGFDKDFEEMKNNGNDQDNLLIIENFISNPAINVEFKHCFQYYTIFNVRKAKFEKLFGITNNDLIKMLEIDKSYGRRSERAKTIIARIQNCFSMLDPNGNFASQQSLDNFRGKFTPCFYPMRYSLKDSIYEQHPIILSYLLNTVCWHYYENGVGYVEFSVGIKDLSNARIYPFLDTDIAFPRDGIDVFGPKKYCEFFADLKPNIPENFHYCFLAGFPRNKTVIGTKSIVERRMFMIKYGMYFVNNVSVLSDHNALVENKIAAQGRINGFLNELYANSIDDIEKYLDLILNRMFSDLTTRKPRALFQNGDIVGLDLMSDENGNPFSPFLHSKIQSKLKKFKEKNKNFGIRLHGGENVFRGSSAEGNRSNDNNKTILDYNFHIHLLVIASEIEAFRSGELNLKCRIGHGLGFAVLALPDQKENDTSTSDQFFLQGMDIPNVTFPFLHNWPFQDVVNNFPLSGIKKCLLKIIKGWEVPNLEEQATKNLNPKPVLFEMNTVSNKTLVLDIFCHSVGSPHADKFIVKFLSTNLCICLGTDNDGIWPIGKCTPHACHSSVAYEYCKALRAIQTFPGIDFIDRFKAYNRLKYFMTSRDGWFSDLQRENERNLSSIEL